MYEIDQLPLLVLCVRKLGSYLANDLPKGDLINPIHQESIKSIMEAVQND